MKLNKYTLLLAGGLTLATTSCNDFLDKEPIDAITPETFLWSAADMSAYLVKQYSFSTHSGAGLGTFAADNGTDNQCSSGYNTRWIPNQWRVSDHYNNDYNDPWYFGPIRNINYFFEVVMPRVEEGSINAQEKMISHNIGEAYFLRAWTYYNKLVTFGDFPIITQTLPDQSVPLIEASKRKPRNEVARFILKDLDEAIKYLKNDPEGGTNRITQKTAYLLKSRVALFEASWETYHKGTALVPGGPGWPGKAEDLASDFNIDTEINFFLDECMKAAAACADNTPLADNIHVWADGAEKMNNPYYAQFAADNMSSYPEILMWRDYDLELGLKHSVGFYTRVGGNSGFTRQFVETFLMKNGLPIYAAGSGYKGDRSLSNVRDGRDERLQLFMMTQGELLTTKPEFKDTLAALPNIFDKDERRNVTGYGVRKGLPNYWCRDWNENAEGCPIFRGAEAYLNYIEASCMKNGGNSIDEKAQNYWRQLRARAGLPEDYMITVNATDLSKENDWAVYSGRDQVTALLYNIRRERRCELMEEGFRFNDLKRWRSLDRLDGTWQPEGMNFWGYEFDLVKAYKEAKEFKTEVKADGSATANMSSKERGNYIRPYEFVNNSSNLLYGKGYDWCEAQYLSPISIVHFRNTAENPSDLSTSVIYQNPGWPLVADQPAAWD